MEVLDILKKNGAELYPEDLAFFEAELDTGEYAVEYIDACKKLISEIRAWKKQKTAKPGNESGMSGNVFVSKEKLTPEAAAKPLTEKERLAQITHDIAQIRMASNYKTCFKQYLTDHPDVNEAFIDQNIVFFMPWELSAILMTMNLSEAFLEKYFASLDAEKIARYQLFSDKFFIRHFSQLDAETVLTKGKNDWRKKENRSAQLDVFLRLKGIKI